MKKSINRSFLRILFVFTMMLYSAPSFAALNAYLKLAGSNGKSYICTADASGTFSFSNVEPGTYKLLWILPPGKGELSGACKIDVSSFSWGVTNSGGEMALDGVQGKTTQVTRSNISNNRTAGSGDPATTDATGQPVTKSTSNIQNNFTTGGGSAGKVSVSDFHFVCDASQVSKSGAQLSCVVLQDIVISSVCSPSGKIGGMSATYDLKQNTK